MLALLLAGPGPASAATTDVTLKLRPATPRFDSTATFSGLVSDRGAPVAGQEVDLIMETSPGVWEVVATTQTEPDGTYAIRVRLKTPGSFAAASGGITSAAVVVALRPRFATRVTGLPYPGSDLYLRGRLRPARAGALTVRVGTRTWRVRIGRFGYFHTRLPTRRPGRFKAIAKIAPAGGFEAVRRERHFRIRAPSLSIGSRGRAVLALERHLRELRYTTRSVNSSYGVDTYESVLAFQKVHRMSRTGSVNRAFWRAFGKAHVPRARHARGTHIEVDKTRQVLFEVRRGKVVRVIHVSTGATGNTPLGRWHIYLKTPGLNGSGMYYSNYFVGAFAIHGYHSVPAWPASHGCVRIPMWQAPGVYARWPLGSTVYIYDS